MDLPAAEWHSHAAAGYQIWYFIITLRKRRGINPVSSCPARLRRAGRSGTRGGIKRIKNYRSLYIRHPIFLFRNLFLKPEAIRYI